MCFHPNMNVFGKVWNTHKSLSSSSTSFKGQTKFHTPRSMRRMEAELDEHKRAVTMFQHVAKHNV
jgi:hypothetical protein